MEAKNLLKRTANTDEFYVMSYLCVNKKQKAMKKEFKNQKFDFFLFFSGIIKSGIPTKKWTKKPKR